MSNVFYLLTVAERSRLPDFMQIFRETGVEVCFVTLGHGTMDTASLRYPPLSSAEKAVCMSFVTEASWRTIKHELETKVKIIDKFLKCLCSLWNLVVFQAAVACLNRRV